MAQYQKIVIGILTLAAVAATFNIVRLNAAGLRLMITHPQATCDQKRLATMGIEFLFAKFIAQNTPQDAVILIPDKASRIAPQITNLAWTYYFIWPRFLVAQRHQNTQYQELFNQATYIMVIAGQTPTQPPYDQTIPAELKQTFDKNTWGLYDIQNEKFLPLDTNLKTDQLKFC
jgi:hypothetical protein